MNSHDDSLNLYVYTKDIVYTHELIYKNVQRFMNASYQNKQFKKSQSKTIFVFNKRQNWFPLTMFEMRTMGTNMYYHLLKYDTIYNGFGVRFYFSINTDGRQQIIMQLKESINEKSDQNLKY
jgi:hypothetical protein